MTHRQAVRTCGHVRARPTAGPEATDAGGTDAASVEGTDAITDATTLALDDDLVTKLRQRCRTTGKSFEDVVNEALRDSLNARRTLAPREPSHVRARSLGLRPGVSLDNVGKLLERLDGAAHKG